MADIIPEKSTICKVFFRITLFWQFCLLFRDNQLIYPHFYWRTCIMSTAKINPLGEKTTYVQTYSPDLLYPVPRSLARDKTGIKNPLPFTGVDIWNGYEISWLDAKGKPVIAFAEFRFPHSNPNVIESKSFKLYLNSLTQTKFDSLETVQKILTNDLSNAAGGPAIVNLYPSSEFKDRIVEDLPGICLDSLEIEVDCYNLNPSLLKTSEEKTEETLYSHLFKSHCLATGQPDWGTVWIRYAGKKIDHASLLKYLISYRNHQGFAEHCTEQLYADLMEHCAPEKLSVYMRFTRRGGLDINPFRTNFEADSAALNLRQIRQ